MMAELQKPPAGARCVEQAANRSTTSYIACSLPAAAIVRHSNGETYCMCESCARHNVKNRGGRYVMKGESYKLTPIGGPADDAATDFLHRVQGDATPANPMNRVAHMAQLMRDAKVEVDRCTAALKAATDHYSKIELEDLPELMNELGIAELTLSDGSKVSVNEDLKCFISLANKAAAHEWIRAGGYGGIIKTALEVEFGRDEDEEARRTADEIRKITDHDVNLDESIHSSTLKAFLKERREAGDNVPADLFGLHVFSRAKLTQPKARK